MKETIKQIEKEIEKMNKTSSLKKFIFTKVDGVHYVSKDVNEILELKAKLQTLQEVCEEIKGIIISLKIARTCKGINLKENDAQIHVLKELLKKFKGEEE